MGMTIDESIKVIFSAKPVRPTSMYGIMIKNASDTAIDTMRKYQKIEEIYKRFQKDGGYYHHMAWLDVMEVVKDGNDD